MADCAVLAANDPEAVVLDLVQPQPAAGRRGGLGGKARRDEAGRKPYAWTRSTSIRDGGVGLDKRTGAASLAGGRTLPSRSGNHGLYA
jgi:hypothetical protein